jgi:hypothetical protein
VIETAPKRGYVLAGAAVLTAAGLAGALWLGSWAFEVRRFATHNGRLERLLAKKPALDLVVQALEEEGTPLVAQADSEADVLVIAGRLGGDKRAEVVAKGKRWPRTRVFRAADMRYFIYFDEEGMMRGFTCVGG